MRVGINKCIRVKSLVYGCNKGGMGIDGKVSDK